MLYIDEFIKIKHYLHFNFCQSQNHWLENNISNTENKNPIIYRLDKFSALRIHVQCHGNNLNDRIFTAITTTSYNSRFYIFLQVGQYHTTDLIHIFLVHFCNLSIRHYRRLCKSFSINFSQNLQWLHFSRQNGNTYQVSSLEPRTSVYQLFNTFAIVHV